MSRIILSPSQAEIDMLAAINGKKITACEKYAFIYDAAVLWRADIAMVTYNSVHSRFSIRDMSRDFPYTIALTPDTRATVSLLSPIIDTGYDIRGHRLFHDAADTLRKALINMICDDQIIKDNIGKIPGPLDFQLVYDTARHIFTINASNRYERPEDI